MLSTDGRSFAQDADDGTVPRFRLRVRGADGGRQLDVEPTGWPDASGRQRASIMAGIATLELPDAAGASGLDLYRGNGFMRGWGAERTRQARAVELTIHLDESANSGAARLCRLIDVERPAAATRDRCTIEAIVDRADGLPLVARIQRTVTGDNRASVVESLTFIRSRMETAAAD